MNNNAKTQNTLYWVFLVGFCLILSLPLLNIQPWFSPPGWGKTIVLKSIISILIFLFVWQILSPKNKSLIHRSIPSGLTGLIFWFLISFAGLVILSSIFSPEPHYSFLASPYRSGGSLNLIFYIVFAILLFLIVRKKDWKKLWFFSIITGILVSIVAILQYFHLFSAVLIPYSGEIPSTIGGPAFLGMYLILLIFPSLSFAIKERNLRKKIFYFLSFFILAIGILVSQSQAAYLGLSLGIIYFIILSPKKMFLVKGLVIILIILGIVSALYLKTHPDNSLNKYSVVHNLTSWKIDQSRLSSWEVSLKALKDRPILGYGFENFSIPFDKYYDPSLPSIEHQPGGSTTGWWDRAHNIFLEIALTVGIPALLIYLSIFAILFWQLQKTKKKNPNKALICHALQATFISYFAANFFNFDTASSYIILFFIITYTLYLISSHANIIPEKTQISKWLNQISEYRIPISIFFLILLIGLIWFNWALVLKPFKINKEINWALHYAREGECQKAINKMEQVLPKHSIIDNYLKLQYIDVIGTCIKKYPEQKADFAEKTIQLLDEAKLLRPTYTRTWLFLGTYINILVENNKEIEPENKKDLLKKADSYFQKAVELSPKHQEIFNSWIKTDLLAGEYQRGKERAQECIDLNPNYASCWWAKAISCIFLGQIEEAIEYREIAAQKGYQVNTPIPLKLLLLAYLNSEEAAKQPNYYQILADLYERLIKFESINFQYHASLSFIYKQLGEYEKAAKEAIQVFVLSPESRINVEEFLKTLPIDDSYYKAMAEIYEALIKNAPKNYQHRASLAFIYKQLGEYQKAKEQAMVILELKPEFKPFVDEFLESLPT